MDEKGYEYVFKVNSYFISSLSAQIIYSMVKKNRQDMMEIMIDEFASLTKLMLSEFIDKKLNTTEQEE